MYTNIDTDLGIYTFKEFLQHNQDKIPKDFPTNLFLRILESVMQNNIFTFADTFWLQVSGTAMGTPSWMVNRRTIQKYSISRLGHFHPKL